MTRVLPCSKLHPCPCRVAQIAVQEMPSLMQKIPYCIPEELATCLHRKRNKKRKMHECYTVGLDKHDEDHARWMQVIPT